MQFFYTNQINQGVATLDEEESRHCIKVLRKTKGDIIQLIDGKGGFYTGLIETPHEKKCIIKITAQTLEYGKRNYSVHIAIAPTKNIDRIEFFVEKAVELGVDEITFVRCEHSERKEIKIERIEKIVLSAVKQSIKAYLPKIHPLISFKDFVKNCPKVHNRFIAYLAEDENEHLVNLTQKASSNVVLIGPEGDFSPAEIELARKENFYPVSLGQSRLRTETAGLVACHILNLVNESE